MLEGLTSALAREVELPRIPALEAEQAALAKLKSARKGLTGGTVPPASKPVLQLAKLPITLDPEVYKNAFSRTNPGGDYRAALSFRALVDPMPFFQPNYTPMPASVEETYGLIIENAQADSGLTQTLISNAKRNFSTAERASLSGDPNDSWRLVGASPPDWWKTEAPGRFREATLTVSGTGSSDYTILGGQESLDLVVGDETRGPLDPATKVKSVTLKCQTVVLDRKWLDTTIFIRKGWGVPGEDPGFCSSGDVVDNPGLLPLIPICILVGADIRVDVEWGPRDKAAIERAGDAPVAVGPFPVVGASSSLLYLVAVISYLTPFSPKG